MNNQPSTFLAFREEFTTTTIDAQELNRAIFSIKTKLYEMRTDRALLTQELALLRTKLPEVEIVNCSIEEFFSKLIEITFTIFSSIEAALLTAGATTEQLGFIQAMNMAGKVFLMSIPILAVLALSKKVASTYIKPITMTFNATFRQPLIDTISYMLIHQDEMGSMEEDKLLNLLQNNIAKHKE